MSLFTKQPKKQEEKKEIVNEPKKTIDKSIGRFYQFLMEPLSTEKGMILREDNQYLFKVSPSANKIEIKKAVENIFNVKVENVNVVNIPRKKRRLGKSHGWKAGYRKAIVALKEGDKIED